MKTYVNIACAVLAALVLGIAPALAADPAASSWRMSISRDYEVTIQATDASYLDVVNAYRRSHGLRSLTVNKLLDAAALRHCRDLARHDTISHYGSDGSDPWERVVKTGYKPNLVAENVAVGHDTFDYALREWKASPGHNENLLEPGATEVGYAYINRPGTEYQHFRVMVFGAPR